MHRIHATAVAVLIAAAGVLGAVAIVRTTGLGSASRHANDAVVAARLQRITLVEKRLQAALRVKTPPLPAVPKVPKAAPAPAAVPVAQAASVQAAAPRVVYRRPAPVVVTVHKHRGDDGGEHEGGEGGGGDD
jgi:hypothetical protein